MDDKGGPRLRWQHTALAVLIAAHLALVCAAVLPEKPVAPRLFHDTLHSLGKGCDFFAVYHAGVNVRSGVSPYDVNADGVTPYFYPFRYLPAVAQAAVPVTLLSPWQAYAAWVVVVEALLAVVIIGLRRRIADRTLWLCATAALLLSTPHLLELYMGQFTFASTALVAIGVLLGGRTVTTCLAGLLKVFTLVVTPAYLRSRRQWLVAVLPLVCVAALTIPYFIWHPAEWGSFAKDNFGLASGRGGGNVGVGKFLCVLFEDTGAGQGWWAVAMFVLRWGLLAGTAVVVMLARGRELAPAVAALLLAHFVTYHQVWEHHTSAVILAGVMLLTAGMGRGMRWVVVGALALLAVPTPFGLFAIAASADAWYPWADAPHWPQYLVVLAKAVPTVALYVCAMRLVKREGMYQPRQAIRAILDRRS